MIRHPEKPISILIIDDNQENHSLLEEQLHLTDLNIGNITISKNLDETFKLLKDCRYSLIFFDLYLPDEPDLQRLAELMEYCPRTPVVIFSGFTNSEASLKALSLGAQDFLIKGDCNSQLLEKSIRYSIERKKNQEIIEENIERFRLVTMATHDMVWDWNLATGEVYRSKEGWKILLKNDLADEYGTADDWAKRVHPEDRERFKRIVVDMLSFSKDDLFEMEYRVRQDDNSYAYIHDRGYIIRNADGQAVRLLGAAQDITKTKEAEQNVFLSEKRFKSLVQSGSDLIAILDADARFTYMSPASKKILGYDPEYFYGKDIFSFIHPDDLKNFTEKFNGLNTEESHKTSSYRCQNVKGDWKWLEATLTDLTGDESVNGIVINSKDITSKKEAEDLASLEKIRRQKEITEAIISAQESERSDIGRELHDNVNQLLGATRLYIDMARKDPDNRDSFLKSSSTYTLNAIDEIRKLSKSLITPLLKDIGLVEAVKDIIDDIMQVHPVIIKFVTVKISEENLNEKFKLNILRIIQEQINNVLKHANARNIQIDLIQLPEKLTMTISDDGIGYDPLVKNKGIGITNVISRAELYKGEVQIESAPGEGCTLSVTFHDNHLLGN